jgi:hypothetical protein
MRGTVLKADNISRSDVEIFQVIDDPREIVSVVKGNKGVAC